MKAYLTPSLLAAVGVACASAAEAAEPVQVLRAGDREMSCEALATEVNSLNQAISERQKAAQAKARRAEGGRKLLGFATAMSSALPALGGGDSPMSGYAAQAAMSALQQGQMAAQMGQLTGAMNDTPSELDAAPEQARIDHLTGIFNAKAC